MSAEKAALRKAIRARYPGKNQRDAESARLCAVIAQSGLFRRANVVAGYVPMAREADIMPLLRLTLDWGKTLLLPRVEGARQMTMRQICDLSALIPGAYGIPEPPESAPILLPDAIDLLLTPLEGVAPDGTRLGKGGGYYDGLLPLKNGIALGCALPWQWVDDIPHESWDIPLDACVDGEEIRYFSGGKNPSKS